MDFKNLEEMIRTAQFDKVRGLLRRLNLKNLKRAERAVVANFANRVGVPLVALKALNPVLRESKLIQAEPGELIQYSHALRRLGAAEEALNVLHRLPTDRFPEILLQKANCYSTLWQYHEAAPLLREFLRVTNPESYLARVAHLNLLSACIALADGEGVARSTEALRPVLDSQSTPLIYGNFLELQAFWAITCGKYSEAIALAEHSRSVLLFAKGTWDALQAEKCIAVARSLMAGKVLPELHEIRIEAISNHQWEVWRDCDFWIARINNDKKLFQHLYFGSPYDFCRKNIEKFSGPMPESYVWTNGSGERIFDVAQGCFEGHDEAIKPAQIFHRVFSLLSRDFYKPFAMLTLHSKLFGGYFDPHNSPNRVHQTMTRFRRWTEPEGIDLKIEPIGGMFRFEFLKPDFGLRVPREFDKSKTDAHIIYLNRAKQALKSEFSTEELQTVLDQSRSTALRILRRAAADGQIIPSGTGNKRRYRFAA